MDYLELHKKAGESTQRFIDEVKDDQWEGQSVDTEWSVKELVNHIVSENLWVPELVEGKTVEEVGDIYDGDVLHGDPKTAYEQAFAAAHEAFAGSGALEKTVHLSYGDFPAKYYLGHQIVDMTIHGWDVAASTGQEDTLDPELVDAVYQIIKDEVEQWRKSGSLGPKIEISDDVDPQTKLLALMGRKR